MNVDYKVNDKLSLGADVSYTTSNGRFEHDTGSVSVDSYSDIRYHETEWSLSGRYDLGDGWGLKADYDYIEFDDKAEVVVGEVAAE